MNPMKYIAALAAVLMLAACGGGGSGGGQAAVPMMAPALTPVVEPEPAPEPADDETPEQMPESPDRTVDAALGLPLDPDPPTPEIPPIPLGFRVSTGIETAILWWDNPFASYLNHGLTQVYRSTTNDFASAAEIGTSTSISFVDENLEGGTTYYYWIAWESDEGRLGPVVSDSGAAAGDPTEAIERISEEVLADPLTQELLTPIGESEAIKRLAERMLEIQAAADNIAAAAGDIAEELAPDPPPLPVAPQGFGLERTGTAIANIVTVQDAQKLSVSVASWGFWAEKSEEALFAVGFDGSSSLGFDRYFEGHRSGSNPVAGSAAWLGGMNAIDPINGAVYGNARLEADLSAATLDVIFTDLTHGHADMAWDDLSMSGGVFRDPTIMGAFYGDGHEGVAGAFSRNSLEGVFGALRQ